MLEFRKTETEHNSLELGHYMFNEFILDIYKNFRFYAAQKNITFKCYAETEINLWFDYKKLQIVINNLLSNAFKYTNDGGSISIDVEEAPNWVHLHIVDSGPGIKKSAQDAIFELYFHSDLEDVVEGTGIGLALCKKLMDLHKGNN